MRALPLPARTFNVAWQGDDQALHFALAGATLVSPRTWSFVAGDDTRSECCGLDISICVVYGVQVPESSCIALA